MSGPPHLTEAAEARFWDGLEATGGSSWERPTSRRRWQNWCGRSMSTEAITGLISFRAITRAAAQMELRTISWARAVGRAQRSDRLSRARGDDFKRRARGARQRIPERKLRDLGVYAVSAASPVSAGP